MTAGNRKLPKWAVVTAAALLFLPLAADWIPPGEGTRLAITGEAFPLWSWLVGLAGKSVSALRWISLGAVLVCVWLVAMIAGMSFGAAIRVAKEGGAKGVAEFACVESAAALLSGLGFALAPGVLVAATRVSPLTVVLLPPLAAIAIVTGLASRGGGAIQTIRRFKKGWPLVLIALGLVGYSVSEIVLARRAFALLVLPALVPWLAVGVAPALLIAGGVRMRWIVGARPVVAVLVGWGLAVAAMGFMTFSSGVLHDGRVASRLVAQIVANAAEDGKIALVSDGTFDELYFFMLPEKIRHISLTGDHDPACDRELAEWVRKEVENEDLAFAAELGPMALVDDWMRFDRKGFETKVASTANFLSTREKWDEACGELADIRPGEPLEDTLRRLLGVCGNALGCRMIEEGDRQGAWEVFWTVSEGVDRENYAALLNLAWLADHGLDVPNQAREIVKRKRMEIEGRFTSWEHVVHAMRSSGRVYVDSREMAKHERERREAAAKREQSPEAKKFVAAVSDAPKDSKHGKAAQEAIHKAIREGKVRPDAISDQLMAIDLALGDVENAERDAIAILKLDRHNPAANAAIGSIAVSRGDYERALGYLRRAVATGRAAVGAKNDLAWALCQLGQANAAEPLAREAVQVAGETWAYRQTLAAVLIRQGKIEEGERELQKAEGLAEKTGIRKGTLASFEIDWARILKARGDMERFMAKMRSLRKRPGLTGAQMLEIRALDW